MPYEPPPDLRSARRAAISRWVSFVLALLLLALAGYLGYIGFQGSSQLAEPPAPSRNCQTPGIAHGWVYEPINYDASTDAVLADLPDPRRCPGPAAPAGQRLQTPDGIGLAGWYIPAAGDIGPTGPTVVLAHGHGSNKSDMLSYAAVLHGDYNVAIFDFRNHGQSGGNQTTLGVLEQVDLKAVIDWLETNKQPEQIAVLGVSMGGATALAQAVGNADVDAVILDSTHATLADALRARMDKAGFPLSLPGSWAILLGSLIRTGQDVSSVDPMQRIGQLRRPVLIIVGGRDVDIGADDGEQLLAGAETGGSDAELRVCPDAGHGASVTACDSRYREWVLGFLDRTLAR